MHRLVNNNSIERILVFESFEKWRVVQVKVARRHAWFRRSERIGSSDGRETSRVAKNDDKNERRWNSRWIRNGFEGQGKIGVPQSIRSSVSKKRRNSRLSANDYLVLVSESSELDHLCRGKRFRPWLAWSLIVRYPHGFIGSFTPVNN